MVSTSSERKNTSGLDRACVLLPPLQREWRCQNGIPAAWRHDIIYLFCTILPPSSHYLCFLETGERECTGRGRGTECFCGENNRLYRERKTGALAALFQQVERF